MQNQIMRVAAENGILRSLSLPGRVPPIACRLAHSLERTVPKARTKEQARGWSAKLSFGTHRKLVNQGYEVL
jgi:hypothetical protein